MKIFKFGGASVKDAKAIRTVADIVSGHKNDRLVVVVSAMGKTTNFLEQIVAASPKAPDEWEPLIQELRERHVQVTKDLALSVSLDKIFQTLTEAAGNDLPADMRYAAIVSLGEILSTTIVHAFLLSRDMPALWMDARKLVQTDDQYKEGQVNWNTTKKNIQQLLDDRSDIYITQGFIGADSNGITTTLGREGSDFTAAILASCLDADSVTVWKDVAGIMNGDPKKFAHTTKYEELPYREAAEMTYYGASVIHPKTIKPLANRNIPLFVKSFFAPEKDGTIIHDCSIDGILPSISIKHEQCLISFQVKDYTFIDEKNLSKILHEISEIHLKINLMQTSAISLSVCTDYHREKIATLVKALKGIFSIRYNTGLELITIKHYNREFLDLHLKDKQILLEQMSRQNYQALILP